MSRPRPQVVLLGASNLTRGLPAVLARVRALVGEGADVRVAGGHGRSYGQRSRVAVRELPSIVDSGLWATLPPVAAGPTYGLLADIGNDLAYGAPVPAILGWLETCALRLAERGARMIVVQLPLATMRRITARQFWFLSRVVFSAKDVRLDDVLAQGEALAAGIEALAARTGAALVEHDAAWYGFDPIHIRYRHVEAAWGSLLAPWALGGTAVAAADVADPPTPAPRLAPAIYIRALPPDRRWILGRELRWPQPVARLPGDLRLFLH